jgi:putative peptidoglycan lipid II flippase
VIAPLLSSVTVMAAYATFALVEGPRPDVSHTSRTGLLVLSVGTTIGVVVLSLCLLIPLRPLGLRLRPTYRFAEGAGPAVRRLAVAGAVTVTAQQLTVALVILLSNRGYDGTLVLFTFAQTVYLLPWAVLALPIATSAYPALAAATDRDAYAKILAPATRGLVLFACLGAAALAGLATPLARVLAGNSADPGTVAAGIAAFAPGLLGYGLFALLSRALYARGDTAAAAMATVAGWGGVAVMSVALAAALPRADRVAALALANSVGMLLLGALLLIVVGRRAGGAALHGVPRALLVGLLAGVLAAAAGAGMWRLVGAETPGIVAALGQGMLCGVVVLATFVGVAYAADRRDVRPLLAGLARRLRQGRSG